MFDVEVEFVFLDFLVAEWGAHVGEEEVDGLGFDGLEVEAVDMVE